MNEKNKVIKNRIADSLEYIIFLSSKLNIETTENEAIKSEIKLHATLSKDLLKYLD